ncbi:ABC transporter ATP-binding protein [Alkalinema pantanalense CENA528]|uniref:ABC transporter ATP-binding protein n=1 Tax=Alkalinema pantanalense TaxID=1620705 RepID=UPI003D6DB743
MAQVILDNIYKTYPKGRGAGEPGSQPVSVLRSINLTIRDGEFMVLVGPSGCGKSTLLRLIAGLEEITGGNIYVGDRLVNQLPPKERDIAMVFQSYALYPHMTVYDNLAFGLRRSTAPADTPTASRLPQWLETLAVETSRKLPKGLRYVPDREQQIDRRVRDVAASLQIEGLLNRLPKQLSGGQKQRVALGRAMARDPQVFLMDEPLSNLDAKLRAETRSQIVKLQRQLGTTTIYVTHDQTEAMTMGDRIAVLNAGQIQQIATPLELYNRPVNRFVAEFIGSPPMNFIPVQVKAPLLIIHPDFRITLPESWANVLSRYDGQTLTLGIRPEHLSYSVPAPKNLPVTVELVEALGSETYITANLAGQPLGSGASHSRGEVGKTAIAARIEADKPVGIGEKIWLAINPDKIHLFNPETGLAIDP